jgi:uncharacterized protein DUF3800
MFSCYFDDAGGKDHGFMIVAGYVANVQRWQQFECDWKIFLAKYDLPYLHMKTFAHSKLPYEHLKEKEGTRAQILGNAATIIGSTVECGFSVSISCEVFEKVCEEFELSTVVSSPYALVGRSCIAAANIWRGYPDKRQFETEYIFDQDGEDVGGLINMVKNWTPKLPLPIFKPSRDMDGQRGFIQLQAADFLAYEARKFTVDYPKYQTKQRSIRKSLYALAEIETHHTVISYESLIHLCKLQSVKRKKPK